MTQKWNGINMAGLEGTITTPFGTVQKKTALIAGGFIAVLAGIVYWREKGTGASASADATQGEIDPATGFVYGTPEDLAALAAQGTDLGGGGNTASGGGSGSIPPGGTSGTTGFASNGDWSQAVIQYMTDNNLVENPAQLSAALGKYLTGAFIDPDDTADTSLIQQAIAVKGYPPIAGPHGFPPAINNHPGSTTPPVTNPGSPKPPTPPPKTLPKRRYVVVAHFTQKNPPWNSTLSGIAGRSGRSVSQLASWNGISNPNVIHTSQHIWIDPPTGFSGSVQWKG
jgi:LysM repeat protein